MRPARIYSLFLTRALSSCHCFSPLGFHSRIQCHASFPAQSQSHCNIVDRSRSRSASLTLSRPLCCPSSPSFGLTERRWGSSRTEGLEERCGLRGGVPTVQRISARVAARIGPPFHLSCFGLATRLALPPSAKEIVLEAVAQGGHVALWHAADELQNDPEVLLAVR